MLAVVAAGASVALVPLRTQDQTQWRDLATLLLSTWGVEDGGWRADGHFAILPRASAYPGSILHESDHHHRLRVLDSRGECEVQLRAVMRPEPQLRKTTNGNDAVSEDLAEALRRELAEMLANNANIRNVLIERLKPSFPRHLDRFHLHDIVATTPQCNRPR
jgi:hypothetical protein